MRKNLWNIFSVVLGVIALTILILVQNESIFENRNSKQENTTKEEAYRRITDVSNSSEYEDFSNIGIPTPLEEVYTINHEFGRYGTIVEIINNYINSSSNVRNYIGYMDIEENKKYSLVSEIYVVEAIDTTYNYFEINDGTNSKYGLIIIDEFNMSYYITTSTKYEFEKIKSGNIDFKAYKGSKIYKNSYNGLSTQ